MNINGKKVQVAVVEDDDAVRQAIILVLKSVGIEAVEFESAVLLLNSVDAIKSVDCIVMDIRMPHMSGIEAYKKLCVLGVHLPVVFITGHGSVRLAVEAMKLGAVEFLEKPFNDQMLIDVVQAASFHKKTTAAASKIDPNKQLYNALTDREKSVFDQLIKGYRNKVVANNLCLSPRTIELYRARIYKKFSVSSLAQLAVIFMDINK